MKLFLVNPRLPENSDKDAVNARLRACVEPIAEFIAAAIERDSALFGVWHESEISADSRQPETSFGPVRVVPLDGPEALRKALCEAGDPFDGKWMQIRSLVTCRLVSYGYDGQAFVCLRTEDPDLVAPPDAPFEVGECSEWLTSTDWVDGLDCDPADD